MKPWLRERLARALRGVADAPLGAMLERRRWFRQARRALEVGRVNWGDMRRLEPFCPQFGFSRGAPVDRYYIDAFIEQNRACLKGDALEVKEPHYLTLFGCPDVRVHVLDIDAENPTATIIGDLCDRTTLAPESFDAVVLTQVFQFLRDPAAAVENVWRALRPGGVALVTCPTMSKLAYGLEEPADLWRWTPAGFRVLLEGMLPAGTFEVRGEGNLLAALAYLMGLAQEDLEVAEIRHSDPIHPLVVTARIAKPRAMKITTS